MEHYNFFFNLPTIYEKICPCPIQSIYAGAKSYQFFFTHNKGIIAGLMCYLSLAWDITGVSFTAQNCNVGRTIGSRPFLQVNNNYS